MGIKFELTINEFEKNKGKKGSLEEVYKEKLAIQRKDKPVEIYLKGRKKKKLAVRLNWDSHSDQIFCLARFDKNKKVRFMLKTKIPGVGDITSFSVGGQDADTGRFVNWSAAINILEKE